MESKRERERESERSEREREGGRGGRGGRGDLECGEGLASLGVLHYLLLEEGEPSYLVRELGVRMSVSFNVSVWIIERERGEGTG
jgi:hypothetical protein